MDNRGERAVRAIVMSGILIAAGFTIPNTPQIVITFLEVFPIFVYFLVAGKTLTSAWIFLAIAIYVLDGTAATERLRLTDVAVDNVSKKISQYCQIENPAKMDSRDIQEEK